MKVRDLSFDSLQLGLRLCDPATRAEGSVVGVEPDGSLLVKWDGGETARPLETTEAEVDAGIWVVGGEFTDTSWRRIQPDTLEVHGPFSSRDAARDSWRSLSSRTLDDCMRRYMVVEAA